MSSTSTPAAVTAPAPHRTSARDRGRRLLDPSMWAEWAALVGLVVLVVVFTALDPRS